MSLDRLFARCFRNLADASLQLGPGVNLLYGENGSGKTSILEAIYFLSSGRSFRSGRLSTVIQEGYDECLVRGEMTCDGGSYELGVERNRFGVRRISLNGEKCSRASDIARFLPTLILGPESVSMLLGSPELRRRFLNWGVFHVEHSFPALWVEANRCLQQRNILLRDGRCTGSDFRSWSAQLAERAEKIDAVRAGYFNKYKPVFYSILNKVSRLSDVAITYYRGWQDDNELISLYENQAKKDRDRGFTLDGFHRADVRLTIHGRPVGRVFSRGELKSLAWCMILAQGALEDGVDKLYLIDDLTSEFDFEHQSRIGGYLVDSGKQVLITGVDRDALSNCCNEITARMFHVKQGNFEAQQG